MNLTKLESTHDQRTGLAVYEFDNTQAFYFDLDVEWCVVNKDSEPEIDVYTFDITNSMSYDDNDQEWSFTFTEYEQLIIKMLWVSEHEEELIKEYINNN